MNVLTSVALSLVLDRIVGDPVWIPHPVVMMGKFVRKFEGKTNKWNTLSPFQLRFRGILLTLTTTVGAASITALILAIVHRVSPVAADILNVWITSTTIAWKGLVQAGKEVYQALTEGGLNAGRQAVGRIVGRDTEAMSETDVVRAAVETLAENIVDAIVSPVLFAALGGAPLAIFYRATNTLDSMVGYKDQRFQYFGWASARLDDLLNYVPARLTALFMYFALFLRRLPAKDAWRIMRRDARKHPSPNSGIPESMMAGGLSIRLGGWNQYGGIPSFRPYMGDPVVSLTPNHILQAIRVVHDTTWILFVLLLSGSIACWIW
jgi:adenosylcobinamide-phosphate synthase